MTDEQPLPLPALPVRKHKALIASARRVAIDDGKSAKQQFGKRQTWQEEAWAYYHEVPEIKFASLWLANLMSKVVFFAGYELEDGTVIPVNSEKSPIADTRLARDAVAEMARLKAPSGGQGHLNWLGTLNVEVVGEFLIHGQREQQQRGLPGDPDFQPAKPEQWSVRSVSMIVAGSEKDDLGRPVFILKESPEDKGRPIDNDNEALLRIWQPDPQWTDIADNHLRSCLSDCEALILLTNQQKAEAKSRQAPGLLLIPSELSFATDPDDDNDGGEPQDQPDQNPFVKSLSDALTEPISNPSSAEAVVPLIISAPAEYIKPDVFRILSFARVADSTLDARIAAKIDRLARGLNVPVEVVMGHMSTTFSNAEQIDEDKFKDHAEPRCDMLADGYEYAYLIPNLQALDYDAVALSRIRVGFEAGAITKSASAEDNADALYDAGLISSSAYRRLKGANDDDAPDDQEWARNLVARKGILTADLSLGLLKYSGLDLGIEVNPEANDAMIVEDGTAPAAPAAPADDVEDEPAPAPVTSSATRHLGRDLAAVDRQLLARLQGAAEGAAARALERAGNRVKNNRALAASASRVPTYRAACDIGPVALTAAGLSADDLLGGAWDEFGQQFRLWAEQAGDEGLDLISQAISGLTPGQRKQAKMRILDSITEAWSWLEDALGTAGAEMLFKPERGALAVLDELGEFATDLRVPPGLLREALAIVGGHRGIMGEPGVLTPSDNVPVGGVATGDIMMDTLRDLGAYVDGYRWVYGPGRRRPFPPHRALAGKTFVNFDDPVLANRSGWPGTAFFYPGDHKGCICDFEPHVIPPDEAPAAPKPYKVPADKPFDYERKVDGRMSADDVMYKTSDLLDKAPPATQDAWGRYMKGDHSDVNRQLRGADPMTPRVAGQVEAIDELFKDGKGFAFKRDTNVYRGVSGDEQAMLQGLTPGARIVNDGFTSTTLNMDTARNAFAGDGTQAMVRIVVPPQARFVGGLSIEHEVILGRAAEFEVLSMDDEFVTLLWKANHAY